MKRKPLREQTFDFDYTLNTHNRQQTPKVYKNYEANAPQRKS